MGILGLGLGLLLVGYLLGLRRSSIWGFTLGSLSFFSLTGVFKGGCQGFHRSFRHWGWLLGGRRIRTCERLDVGIVIYALRPPQTGVSRDPSGVKGFTSSDVAIVPGDRGKLFSQSALSLFNPESKRSLFLSLCCLFL